MIPVGWGTVVFAIIEIPMLLLILAAIFGRPRMYRAAWIFIGSLAIMLVAFVISFYIIGALLGLFVPGG